MDGTAPPLWAHLRKLTALFLGLSLFSVGFGLLMSVVALRLAQQGHDELTVGGVNAAFYLGGVIGSVYCAGGLARVGHVRTFAAYAALLAVATLAHTLWLSAPAWAILRLASGFCFYGLLMTVESWLNERANESGGRGRILGVYMVLYFLSYSAGQLLLNLGPGDGGRLFALSAMLIAASLVPVALTRIAEPGVVAVSRFELRRLLHLSRLAVAGAFLGGLMQGIFLTLGPVYGLRIGLDVAEISMLMTAGLLGGPALPITHKSPLSKSARRQLLGAMAQEWPSPFQAIATTQMAPRWLARREPRDSANAALRPLTRATAIACGPRLALALSRGSETRLVSNGQGKPSSGLWAGCRTWSAGGW